MNIVPIKQRLLATSISAFTVITTILQAQTNKDQIVDLSQVPQTHETTQQRDARMQWFRDAKFGMFNPA